MSLHQSSRSSVSIFQSNRCSTRNALLAATALTIVSGGAAWANDGDANDLLLKKMEKMERRIQSFEAELKQKQTSSPAAGAKPAPVSVPAPPKSANTEIPPGKPADASNTLGSALATLPTPGDEDVPLLHEFGERRVTAQTWMVLPKNAHVSA